MWPPAAGGPETGEGRAKVKRDSRGDDHKGAEFTPLRSGDDGKTGGPKADPLQRSRASPQAINANNLLPDPYTTGGGLEKLAKLLKPSGNGKFAGPTDILADRDVLVAAYEKIKSRPGWQYDPRRRRARGTGYQSEMVRRYIAPA